MRISRWPQPLLILANNGVDLRVVRDIEAAV